MAISIGAVSGMPPDGARGVDPTVPLTAQATVTDTTTGLAYLEIEVATDAAFTNVVADIRSLDAAAATGAVESLVLRLNGLTRDAGLWPFGGIGTTVWNTAIGVNATYAAAGDTRVTDLAADAGNVNSVSYPVFFAEATDSNAVVTAGSSSFTYAIPATAAPSGDATAGLVVVSPDHTSAYETVGTVAGSAIGLIPGNLFDINTQDLESNIGTWAASTFFDAGCTVARTNTQSRSGSWSLQLNSTAAQSIAVTGAVGVAATTSYTVILYCKGTVGRNPSVVVRWLNSINQIISDSGSGTVLMDGSWDALSATVSSPAGAVNALVYFVANDSVSGDVYYLDFLYLGTNASPGAPASGWTATRISLVDLVGISPGSNGSGYPGIRGSGSSALAGMIRQADFLGGAIPHALAVGLSLAELTQTAVWPAAIDAGQLPVGGTGTIPGNLLDANTENLETTQGQWVSNTNATPSRDNTHASFGTWSLKVVAIAAGACIVQTTYGATPVSAGTNYTMIAQIWAPSGITVAPFIQWTDAGGGFIRNDFGSAVTGNGTSFLQASFSHVSPSVAAGDAANAAFCAVYLDATNAVLGTTWWADSIYLGTNATPGAPSAGTGGATGHNPMGSLLAIPRTVNLAGLGLTTANSLMVATALQKWGAYVVGIESGFRFYAEPGMDATFLANLATDSHLIVPQLRPVTNSATSLVSLAAAGAQGGGTALAGPPPPLAQTPPPSVPISTSAPVISGNASVGSLLSTTNGFWSGNPTSFTYAWKRNGVTIAGATGTTYVLVTADNATNITCQVTATNAVGSSSATSNSITIGSTFSLQTVINFMTVSNEPHYPVGPEGYSWQRGPDYAQLPPGSGSGGEGPSGAFTSGTVWGWIWPDHAFGNPPPDPPGVSIQLRRAIFAIFSNFTNSWKVIQATDDIYGEWDYGPGSSPPPGKVIGSGIEGQGNQILPTLPAAQGGGVYFTPQTTKIFQFYPHSGWGTFGEFEVQAAYSEWQARVIVTPGWGGANNLGLAHYLGLPGADWRTSRDFGNIPNAYNSGALPIPADGSWGTYAGWTGPRNFDPRPLWIYATSAYPNTGWSIAQLQANPPPLHFMG